MESKPYMFKMFEYDFLLNFEANEGGLDVVGYAYLKNGRHLYSAFIQSAVQLMPFHSPTHTHTHTHTHQRRLAAMQGTNQEQFGVRHLAQGHFETPRGESNRQPSDWQKSALTPEPMFSFMQRSTQVKLTLRN